MKAAKQTKKAKRTPKAKQVEVVDTKMLAAGDKPEAVIETPAKPKRERKAKAQAPAFSPEVAKEIRANSTRRSAQGKFNAEVFKVIGGAECPGYQKLTWVQRDALHLENAAVRERYEAHMASLAVKPAVESV
jgi:hypothetical protein